MTLRLAGLARNEWASLDGLLASRGEDPLLLPPDRFFNLIYWWAVRNAADQDQIDKFNRRLWRPPKGKAAPAGSPWSPEAETAAFAALAAQVGATQVREGSSPPAP